MDTRWFKNSFIYLLILIAVMAVFFTVFQQPQAGRQVDISEIMSMARNGELSKIEVGNSGENITATRNNSTDKLRSRKESTASIFELLQQSGVDLKQPGLVVSVNEAPQLNSILNVLFGFLPIIVFGAILIFMMRQAQGTNNQAMSFGKSRARMFTGNRPTVTFADVAGVEEPKQELQEVVEFLKFPEKFNALGARIPRGVLLMGPPGTGKTLLSRAVAGEAGVPFFSISGSEFVEMFVGVGASRVRDLFDQAKRNSPCIVFVDEIDAVGRQRGSGLGGSHDEREQTLNQILVEMDGFDTSTNVIVIAATNRPDVLDPALLRPGRFDRQVVLDRPDIAGRIAVLGVHAKGKPIDPDVDMAVLAKQTPGFSGADLANMVNEGAILAARRNKKTISLDELEEAIDRVSLGPERKSRIISPKQKEKTAYHEGGHALVARMLPNSDPVHKISIVSRGMALGYTMQLPDEDRYGSSESEFKDRLAIMMGGLVAERLVYGEHTTGPGNDIERATGTARRMVTQFGMSEKLGPRTFGRKDEMVFLGREISEQRDYSDKVAQDIDDEVHRLITEAYDTANRLLTLHRNKLERLAKILIEKETLEGAELETAFSDLSPESVKPAESPAANGDAAAQPGVA